MEKIKELTGGWYSRLDDLVNDLKDAGYAVEDANREIVTAWSDEEDDVMYTLYLDGTDRTFWVKQIAEERL